MKPFAISAGTATAILAAVAFLFPGWVKSSVPPKLSVNAPTTGVPGEPLFFSYAQTTGTLPFFDLDIVPKKSELHVEHEPLQKRFRVNGYPGTYRISIMAMNLAGRDKWETTIHIPGETPCPSCPTCPDCPKPVPCPQPTPVDPVKPAEPVKPVEPTPIDPTPPAGRFNVAPEVYRLAKTINDPTTAAKLATACRTLADGSHSSLNALAVEVVKTLATLPSAWSPLTSKVKASIAALYTEGKLQNRDDAAELLREVAGALEAAGK